MKVFNVTKANILPCSSTSKGNQIKWVLGDYYIKADTVGYEGLAEYIASLFSSCIYNFSYTEYNICKIIDKNKTFTGCYSTSFITGDLEVVTLDRLLRLASRDYSNFLNSQSKYYGNDDIKFALSYVINQISATHGVDVSEYLFKSLIFDALILNEDRHFNNLAMLVSNKGIVECPNFDNGLSLLSDIKSYNFMTGIKKNMSNVESAPFSVPFERQYNACLNLGAKPLVINRVLLEKLLSIKSIDGYKDKYVKRALTVLKLRLKELENILWV